MLRSPAFPIAALMLVMPGISVLQFRAIAPLAIAALGATVALAWAMERRPPWPRGAALWAGLALFAWAGVSAAWSPDPRRAVTEALLLGGFLVLGSAAAGVIARSPPWELRRLRRWLAYGLAIGVAMAALDHASGNGLRALVRGIRDPQPTLGFGLKPAMTVMALILPLALAAPLRGRWRLAIAAATLATLFWLPAESAKIAVLAGLAMAGAGWLAPRLTRPTLAALLALLILAVPALLGPALQRAAPFGWLPFSAAHRVVIWDFALARMAERPLLGWGLEASRAIPGGQERAAPETLTRLGLDAPAMRDSFARPAAQSLPLHPHNGPLQIRLELGWVGAALAALFAVLVVLRARAAATLGLVAAATVVGCLSYGIWQGWWIGLLLVLAAASRALPGEGLEHPA